MVDCSRPHFFSLLPPSHAVPPSFTSPPPEKGMGLVWLITPASAPALTPRPHAVLCPPPEKGRGLVGLIANALPPLPPSCPSLPPS